MPEYALEQAASTPSIPTPRQMTVGIVARHANTVNPTGVEHYCQQLILAISKIDPKNRYILYLPEEPVAWMRGLPSNFTVKVVPVPFAWTQVGVSWQVMRDRPDALLVPSFAMPLIHPKNSVVTIHDLAWRLFPDTHRGTQRLWLQFTHWFACHFAKNLIAVSAQTKSDLAKCYLVPGDRVTIIHHGFSKESEQLGVQSRGTDQERKADRARIAAIDQPFLLYLGTLQPRKNLNRLIDAFIAAKARARFPHKLVIAGRKGWWCQDTLNKIKQNPDIIYFGYVLDRLALLRKAAALVLPSTYEGFGLTILDAFSENVPVICSNCSSLPEVAGDAAELFDPHSTESIAEALIGVLTNARRPDQLIAKGRERLKQFSWENCARQTLELLQTQS